MQVVFVFAWLVSVVPTRIQVRTYVRTYVRVIASQEDMSSRATRRHVLWWGRKACIIVQHQDMSPCCTGGHVLIVLKAGNSKPHKTYSF